MRVNGASDVHTTVRVEVVEPLGDDVIVHGTVDARAAESGAEEEDAMLLADGGDTARAAVSMRVDPATGVRVGDEVPVSIDPAKIHLFDATTGDAIRAGS